MDELSIRLAVKGDPEAALKVLESYRRYIAKFSRKLGYYDVEAQCHMEAALLQAILKFRLP